MGSGSSKDVAASSSGGLPKPRSRRVRVFKSSCFGLLSVLPDGHQKVDADRRQRGFSCVDKDENKKVGDSNHGSEKVGLPHHDNLAYSHSDGEQFREDNETTSQIDLGTGSNFGTDAITERSSNTSGRSHSRFSFIPDGISFRLNRAVSLGSTGSRSIFSTGLSVPFSTGLSVPSDRRENNLINHENVDRNCIQNDSTLEAISSQDETRINAGTEATISQYSSRSFVETRNTRHTHRRIGSQEPLEGTVRFSRTLSVGRLRDRVLRRAPFSEGLFDPAFPEDRSVWSNGHANGRRAFGGARRAPSSSRRASELLPDSSGTIPYRAARSIDINADIASGAPHHRVGNHDVFEHRSVFLERRRRIRSQVRALQRLGSRFESLSGHDRSCILSGQHRTGRCTCRTNSQTANPDEDTSARASISRIVMLAEALFEVLDEIHQQSVVLSSRPSFSSIGSVPAPKEVVECIPTKIYGKPSKNQNEETSQCYICLVEYEEGDCLRMLPCNHEFHQTCIDKWLKEIHRVCPLCRGDVCISDASNKQLS